MLRVDSLAVRRGGRTIIEDISLAAAPAEIVGVVGKNGCGKSTLLTCIAGVLPPRDGVVEIDGASVWGSHAERTRARAALGYVPEAADPPGFMTGAEL
ncbi:MAG: ABC transporter ATP-binding protein, partial [Myxococcota bacterium]|nr:ABC transporter ATP-binding protein [Myxococcota bacterium]